MDKQNKIKLLLYDKVRGSELVFLFHWISIAISKHFKWHTFSFELNFTKILCARMVFRVFQVPSHNSKINKNKYWTSKDSCSMHVIWLTFE